MAKRRRADFDESGTGSTLETEFEEIGKQMAKRTLLLLQEIDELTAELAADKDAASRLSSASEILALRKELLMAAKGSTDATKEVNIKTWNEFRLSPRAKELLSEKKESMRSWSKWIA